MLTVRIHYFTSYRFTSDFQSHHALAKKRYVSYARFLQLENLLHEMPFLGGGHGGVAALEAGDVGLPLGLTGKGREAGVVLDEIKVVGSVHDHEHLALEAVNLHVEYADRPDAFLNLGPYMTVCIYIILYHLAVSNQIQSLTVSFH